jgi:hypothetical protein
VTLESYQIDQLVTKTVNGYLIFYHIFMVSLEFLYYQVCYNSLNYEAEYHTSIYT